MNVLSINTPKGLYVLTHRRLSLDARSKTLVAGDTVTIDREYTPLCESVPAKSRCAFVTAAAGLAAGREKRNVHLSFAGGFGAESPPRDERLR